MQIAETDTWANHASGKSFSTTSGTTNTIDSAGDLAQLAKNVNAGTTYSGVNFKQTTDINLGGYDWIPIGTYTTFSYNKPFSGNYDGQNHKIEGLTIYTSQDYQGLFGYARYANISNINLLNGGIVGGNNVGGIIGYGDGPVVNNCKNDLPIRAQSYGAGIVGSGVNNTVDKCINTAPINVSGDNAGGIFGFGGQCLMSNCLNYGDIFGNSNVGGFAGDGNRLYASNSISDCTIIGTGEYVGAMTGIGMEAEINCCAAFGHIIYMGSNVRNLTGFGVDFATACSFYGTSNIDFDQMPYSASACWMSCNGVITTSGTVDDSWTEYWVVVPNINGGLPILKDLYAIAEGVTSTATEIANALK